MQKGRKHAQREMTLTGIVQQFDDLEAGIGVLIAADDDENYLVDLDKKGNKLFNHLDERVRFTGMVTRDEGGNNRIRLSSFEVMEDKDDG